MSVTAGVSVSVTAGVSPVLEAAPSIGDDIPKGVRGVWGVSQSSSQTGFQSSK